MKLGISRSAGPRATTADEESPLAFAASSDEPRCMTPPSPPPHPPQVAPPAALNAAADSTSRSQRAGRKSASPSPNSTDIRSTAPSAAGASSPRYRRRCAPASSAES